MGPGGGAVNRPPTAVTAVDAWEILDSRGSPTVACQVTLRDGAVGVAGVPSGASTGSHEARELRDGGHRYGGRGTRRAAAHARGELAAVVIGCDAADQRDLDARLRAADGTPDLSRLGANAVLALSVAAALAVAASRRCPPWAVFATSGADGAHDTDGTDPLLPVPMVNVVSGGAHAGGLIDIQDVLVVPVGATSFGQALEWAARVRAATAEVAGEAGLPAALVADEGGVAGPLATNEAALEMVLRGIERSGLRPGDQVALALDVAATQLQRAGAYHLRMDGRRLTAAEVVAELASWCARFPVVSVEDPLAEDDWDGWAAATRALAGRQVVGDDLFVTSLDRLERGIAAGVANAVLVKPNQTGTLSDAAAVVRRAREAGYATVVSARSGETEDDWLADLAVGWRAGQIKVGSTTRSERTVKWNRLLRIERQLGDDAPYAGPVARP